MDLRGILMLCVFAPFELNTYGATQSFCHSVGVTTETSACGDDTCIPFTDDPFCIVIP